MNRKPLLLFSCLLILTNSWAQSVLDRSLTLSYSDVPLEEILSDLEQSEGIKFSYSPSLIPVQEKISIEVVDATLAQTLDQLFETFPVKYVAMDSRIILKYAELEQTVRGTVKDRDSQSPVIGANLVVVNSDPLIGASTDLNGKFRIENVPVGRYILRVNYLGYESLEFPILVGTGKETVLNLGVVESVVKMRELVIKSTAPGAQPVNDLAVVSARSFTPEETKRYAAGIGDPARLALAYPGVTVGEDGTNEIIIRGNSPRGLLWRLEGVEIPSPNHFSAEGASSGGISMLNTNVMSRSDFFTGAFPAQYGNALSGAFDIFFKKGNNEKREHTFQAGFLGLELATEGPFKKGGESSYVLNYRYSTLAVLDKLGLPVQEEGESNVFQDLAFKMYLPTRKFGNFTVFGMGGASEFKAVTNNFFELETYDMGVVGVTNQYPINSSTFVKTTVSWTGSRTKDDIIYEFQTDTSQVQTISTFKKSFAAVSSSVFKKVNAQHFLEGGLIYRGLGYNYSSATTNSFNTEPFTDFERFNDEGNSASIQAYGTWKYRMADNLSLITGLHTMHFRFNSETSVEPRAGLKWQFTPTQSFNAGFGYHSRIESLEYYLGNFINPDGSTTQHNRGLALTKARHYVLGYQQQLTAKTFLRLEGYYQDLYDVPVLADVEAPPFASILFSDDYTVDPVTNNGIGQNYGIEVSLERSFANDYYFLINAAVFESKYTAQDGIERNTPYNGHFNSNMVAGKEFRVGRAAKNNIVGINIKSLWAGGKRYSPIDLEASIEEGQTVRDLSNAFESQYPNYFRLDLQLNYRKNKPKITTEWRLDIQNLTNRENIFFAFYDSNSQSIQYEYQLSLIPVLSYRIEF